MGKINIGRPKAIHPYAWLWEPLESDPSFVVRSMFGAKVVYLDGRLMLCFAAKVEPWRGVLVCTDRKDHAALTAEFPSLTPHTILPKWLYIAESDDHFERVAERLVSLVKRRDLRIGVAARAKKSRKRSPTERTVE